MHDAVRPSLKSQLDWIQVDQFRLFIFVRSSCGSPSIRSYYQNLLLFVRCLEFDFIVPLPMLAFCLYRFFRRRVPLSDLLDFVFVSFLFGAAAAGRFSFSGLCSCLLLGEIQLQ